MAKFDDFLKFAALVTKTAPLLLSLIPGGDKIQPYIPKVVEGIQEAQQIPGATGADMKKHVITLVVKGIEEANLTGKVKVNPSDVVPILDHGIDTVVETVKLIHKPKTTTPTA